MPVVYLTLMSIPGIYLEQKMAVLKLGDIVPNFQAATTQGHMDFHTWLGGR